MSIAVAAAVIAGAAAYAPAAKAVYARTGGPSKVDTGHPRGKVPQVKQGQQRKPVTGKAGANANCAKCVPPLIYAPGHVVIGGLSRSPGQVTVTPVYWAPPGYGFTPAYRSIIDGYLQNIAAASAEPSNANALANQYYQQDTAPGSPKQHIDAHETGDSLRHGSAFERKAASRRRRSLGNSAVQVMREPG